MRALLVTTLLTVTSVLAAGEVTPPPEPDVPVKAAETPGEKPQAKPEAEADDGMVTVNFRDTSILAVIDFYSKMLGKTFIVDNKLKAKITVISPGPVKKEQALAMFDTILQMQGYGLVETDGYIKVVQRAKITRESRQTLTGATPADRIVTEVVTLQHIPAQKIVEQIRPLLSQEGNIIVSEHLNSLVLTDTAGNIAKLKSILTALDTDSKAMQTVVYRMKFTGADKLVASLPSLLTGGGKDGMVAPSVALNKETNSIIVTGNRLIHKRMLQLLKSLDTRPGQVLIRAKIVEVSLTASSRFGLEWKTQGELNTQSNNTATYKAGQSLFNLDTKTMLDAVTGLRFSLINGTRWTYLMNAFATSEDVNLLSSPNLVAMDGQTAKLHVGEEIPILKESRVDQNNNPVNSFDYEKVGIDLTIKPKLVGDDEVQLTIKQEVSTLLQFNEERLTHRIGERMAETVVIIKNRHTLVIGGLLKDSERKTNGGVPVLKNIPVLGKFFSQQSQTNSPEKTELLIFITPIIMGTPEEADRVTEQMKEEHPKTYINSGEDFKL